MTMIHGTQRNRRIANPERMLALAIIERAVLDNDIDAAVEMARDLRDACSLSIPVSADALRALFAARRKEVARASRTQAACEAARLARQRAATP